MDRVCVYNIVCKHIWSNVPINVAGRLNFYHKGINEMQQSEAQDNLFAAAGAVKGAFISIGRTPKEGQDINVVPMPALGFFYMCVVLSVVDIVLKRFFVHQ